MFNTFEIGIKDKIYPKALREIFDCPKKIYCRGNVELLKEKRTIAIVGSREMSGYGKKMVDWLVPELVKMGFVIVSGMAFGIDTEVHKICLENGGKTIAVLASGSNIPSPSGNGWLYRNILKDGLVISENHDGYMPQPHDFVKRNRLIAGLSSGVVVIEGAKNSGSLITARLAIEQGKDVFAVPGRVGDKNSFVPNFLIKMGAHPVDSVSVIKDVLN